jgi:ketosteroid isomerase-like protein
MSAADESRNGVEEELRENMRERVNAVHAKDPAPLAARQAPDIVTFDVLPPLHARGSDVVEAKTQAWFDAYAGDIGSEVQDLQVTAHDDVGFCSFLYRVSGTLASGGKVDMWVRATLGCRRIDGKWLITHDHESVPFDAETGQALTDLNP